MFPAPTQFVDNSILERIHLGNALGIDVGARAGCKDLRISKRGWLMGINQDAGGVLYGICAVE